MAISDYYDLQDTIARWLERYDITESIPDLIKAGEIRIADDIKLRKMEKLMSSSLATDAYMVDLPSDWFCFKDTVFLVDGDGDSSPLTQRTSDFFLVRNSSQQDSGKPSEFYIDSDDRMVFDYKADEDYTVSAIYYYRLHLSDEHLTNWILENYPYVLVYATLIEANIFIEDDPRRFEAMYMEQLDRMRRHENRANHGSGPRIWRQCSLDGVRGTSPRGVGVDLP